MRENRLTRRSFAAAAPIAAFAGVLPTAAFAGADQPSAASEIEAAALRCRAARQALTDALDAYEGALPPPHFTLDMTDRKRWTFTAAVERRLFDGKVPMRTINRFGIPAERYVATAETIEQDLWRCADDDRQRRRLLFCMRRRAKARAARVAAMEASFGLDALQDRLDVAERHLEEATQAIFAAPAATYAEVIAQARALSAYAASIEAQHATYQAGRFGKVLADGLQHVARAA